MARILKLELKGFKSFANRVEIPFGNDFNCVLGPNGSGKSNILDAVCFVLGKAGAKGLRAEKTANLIYNGGKTKKPAKEGEVSIYFSNENNVFGTGTEELKITRVIKSSGQGLYRINDETVTRQQILDVLSRAKINPDGYNIILQGDIVRLVEMSGIERRHIIEEISGINIYEEKKQKALKELEKVKGKISEADIILTERKTHLDELKQDRDKAQKFKELDEKIKRNKATVLKRNIDSKNAEKEKNEKAKAVSEQKINEINSKIDKEREVINKNKERINELNKEVEEKGEKEQVELNKEIEQLKVDTALAEQRVKAIEQELEKIKNRRVELNENHKEVVNRIKILEDSKKEIEEKIESNRNGVESVDESIKKFKEKNNLDGASEIDKEIEEIDKKIESKQEEITRLRDEQQNTLREKDKYETKLQGIDEKIEKLLSVEKENKESLEKLKQLKKEFKNTTSELSKALAEDSNLASQQSNAHTKLLSKKEEHSRLRAKALSLRERTAGGEAINEILNLEMNGVHGLISELGNVKQEHSQALEVAAGGRLKSIVVENDEIASKCINHLKNKKAGVATFIPLNKIRGQPINSQLRNLKKQGVVGLAIDLIDYDPKYSKAFEFVFGNTLVVEDIKTARSIGIGSVRMVTLSGDVIEISGSMQGGFRSKNRGGGFAEKQVKEQMDKLENELNEIESVVNNLTQKRSENEEKINRLRELKANMEGDIITLEKTLRVNSDDMSADKNEKEKLQEEIEQLDKKLEEIIEKVTSGNRELAGLKQEKQKLRDKINNLRNPALLAELTSYEQKKTELNEEYSQLKIDKANAESEIKNIHGPESERVKKIFKQIDREEEDLKNEKEKLEKELKSKNKDLKEKEERAKEFYAKFKEVFNERNKHSEDNNKRENQILRYNEERNKKEQEMNVKNMEMARIKAELSGLEEEYKQYEEVPIYKDKDLKVIQKEIKDFEKMQEDIGAVNMRALEIYEKVVEEYKKLNEKKEKLIKEQEDVLVMINEVDSKKKELFMKTYDVISHNFKTIFGMLSTKGEAEIELENKKEPLEGGLNIKVRLSGKKFLDIRSLSGGEKTMTALAFIFAVQEYEPAAFYVLDEVDAALDKKNSERLAKLVKKYSQKAQYVIISHNDGVIQEADNLYGISMDQHGRSKITSLKV